MNVSHEIAINGCFKALKLYQMEVMFMILYLERHFFYHLKLRKGLQRLARKKAK